MAVYMIADLEVIDSEMYGQYMERVRPIVLSHGGRYLVRGGRVLPLAGDWRPERLLVIEFDSLEGLQTCFASEEYREIAPLRERSTRSRSIIVEGAAASGT